jgi:hypothetical protein
MGLVVSLLRLASIYAYSLGAVLVANAVLQPEGAESYEEGRAGRR